MPARTSFSGKSSQRAIGVLILLLVTFGIWRASDLIARQSPMPEAQLRQAWEGITQNGAWKPLIRQFKGLDWALAPAGCFSMGSTEAQLAQKLAACRTYGGENCPLVFDMVAQPGSQVCLEAPYWIGLTEVTNREYGSSSSTNMITMYRGPNWPRETVTWQEAHAFCESLGARLPTEAEWEYVARGPDGLLYPWGDEISPAFREQANMLNPEDVDSVPADTSWVGALGMSGNVMEWIADAFDPTSTPIQNVPDTIQHGELRIARGGSWASYANFLLQATQRIPHGPEYASSVLGFRCVHDFEVMP